MQSTLTQQLQQRSEARRPAALRRYRELATASLSRTLDAQELASLEEAMETLGVTTADLAADLKAVTDAEDLRCQIAAIQSERPRREELARQLAPLDERRDAINREWHVQRQRIRGRLDIDDGILAGAGVRRNGDEPRLSGEEMSKLLRAHDREHDRQLRDIEDEAEELRREAKKLDARAMTAADLGIRLQSLEREFPRLLGREDTETTPTAPVGGA